MEKVFTAVRSILLVLFTGAMGACTIWMVWHLQWYMVIICGILTVMGLGFISYTPDRVQEPQKRVDNPRLRELITPKNNTEDFQAGRSFHMLNIQWYITKATPHMIECLSISPGLPRVEVAFGLPDLEPYGGEVYQTNKDRLIKLYELKMANSKEVASIKKAAIEVSTATPEEQDVVLEYVNSEKANQSEDGNGTHF